MKNIFITGASSGFGEAVALKFLRVASFNTTCGEEKN